MRNESDTITIKIKMDKNGSCGLESVNFATERRVPVPIPVPLLKKTITVQIQATELGFQSVSLATEGSVPVPVPLVNEESHMVNVKITGYDGGSSLSLSFATERSVPLRRIFLDFCHTLGFQYNNMLFLFDGRRISDLQTAEEIDIDDGEVIDAFHEMRG